jgi:hypothetical protein
MEVELMLNIVLEIVRILKVKKGFKYTSNPVELFYINNLIFIEII